MPGLLDYLAPKQPDTIWGFSKEDIARMAPAFRAPERNALPVAHWLLENVVPGSSDAVSLRDAYDASGRVMDAARAGEYGKAAIGLAPLLAASIGVLPAVPNATKAVEDAVGVVPKATKAIRAYHGSPHDLDMGTAARMGRADALGYTIDAYKGAYPYDYNTAPTKNWRGEIIEGADKIPQELTSFDTPGRPYAGFFSDRPEVANRFAELFGEGAVYKTKLKFENPVVIDAGGKPAAAFQFESVARDKGTLDEFRAFQTGLSDKKHDGVILKNTSDEGTVYVPKAAQQIRSIFARFDPREAGSGNMLAGLAGLLGIGAALSPSITSPLGEAQAEP